MAIFRYNKDGWGQGSSGGGGGSRNGGRAVGSNDCNGCCWWWWVVVMGTSIYSVMVLMFLVLHPYSKEGLPLDPPSVRHSLRLSSFSVLASSVLAFPSSLLLIPLPATQQ